MTGTPFLRIPPFPGHRGHALTVPGTASGRSSSHDGAALAERLRRGKVGGNFWGVACPLPPGRDIILCPSDQASVVTLLDAARKTGLIDRSIVRGKFAGMDALPSLSADSDPWHLCEQAAQIIADANDEIALVAALNGSVLQIVGEGRFADLRDPGKLATVVQDELRSGWQYCDPYDGQPISVVTAIEILARWRTLIAANRQVSAIYGIARWKRITADVLLWDGTNPVRHGSSARQRRNASPGNEADLALAWLSRSDAAEIAQLKASGVHVGEIEDGLIRSNGLGANCVPPLSIVVDAAGPHFDPARASGLETILQTATIDDELLHRARRLREQLVSGGISKYGQDNHRPVPSPRADARRQVLVTAQVEDDRSVLCGGGGLDNLELLRRVRAAEPDAHIIFKPHPDVEAGHRKGHVPDTRALEYASEIDRSSSIAALLDRVDAVHVLTSLAGFEALMRGLEVITHGVPFYAGWGLTRDLGPVPARRTRQRSLDELVAAALILYPRYVDPVSRLPCEAELLVERIASGRAEVRSPLIRLREAQGRFNRVFGRAS